MKCKICFNLNKKNLSFTYSHQNIKYYKCQNCYFVFQYPLPSKKKLKKIYNTEYFNQNYFEIQRI